MLSLVVQCARRLRSALALCAAVAGLVCAPGPAAASVVSRLGDIYFYDPLSFDAGVLQRGMGIKGGAGTDQGDLEMHLDLPFYREFSLRTAYVQRFNLGGPDGHDLTWRFRMPILESARFARISSVQAIYAGSVGLGMAPDRLMANHLVGAGHSWGRSTGRVAHSVHGQALFVVRDLDKVLAPEGVQHVPGGRVGAELRLAHLFQLHEPHAGPGGKWTTTLSSVEVDLVHYGGRVSEGAAGRLNAVVAAPAVHFTPRYATYTLGLVPRVTLRWGPDGQQADFGALANLTISYRTHLE